MRLRLHRTSVDCSLVSGANLIIYSNVPHYFAAVLLQVHHIQCCLSNWNFHAFWVPIQPLGGGAITNYWPAYNIHTILTANSWYSNLSRSDIIIILPLLLLAIPLAALQEVRATIVRIITSKNNRKLKLPSVTPIMNTSLLCIMPTSPVPLPNKKRESQVHMIKFISWSVHDCGQSCMSCQGWTITRGMDGAHMAIASHVCARRVPPFTSSIS